MTQTQRRYTRIDRDEFESFLDDFVAYELNDDTDADELVYSIDLPHDDLELRIFSTLQNDVARDRGADAIRTVIWNTEHDVPVGGRVKTLRIETWRSNLRPKIEDLMLNWRDEFIGYCPDCGSPLALRDGEYGEFAGCTAYPRCEFTRNI